MNINKYPCLILFIMVYYSNNDYVEGGVTLNEVLNALPQSTGPNFVGGAIEYCIYLQLLNTQAEIVNLTSVPDEKIQKFKKTMATVLRFMGSNIFNRNYNSLFHFYGELEAYANGKGTLHRINEIINNEIQYSDTKIIIQQIQEKDDKDKLNSECDALLNSIINEELQTQFIQLLDGIGNDENPSDQLRNLVTLYRMITKLIPSNSSEIISISDYKNFRNEGNQLKINNAFINEYFKNTLLAYKEFISAVQKISILDIKEDARIEYIKFIYQEYLETLHLLSNFEKFDENVFEENSVSNFAKDFNSLNKNLKDYFYKCLSDIGITEKIEKDLPELHEHVALTFLLYGIDGSDNSSETSDTNKASADPGKEHVKLSENFYPDLKNLLPNVKDIMNAKVLRLVISVFFTNFIETEGNKVVEPHVRYNTFKNILPTL